MACLIFISTSRVVLDRQRIRIDGSKYELMVLIITKIAGYGTEDTLK